MSRKKEKKVTTVVKAAEAQTLGQVVDAVISTDPGKRLFVWLHNRLGFTKSSLSRKRDGAIDEESTSAMEAQRLVYLELRRAASLELLAPVEEMAERQDRLAATPTISDGKSQEEVRK